MSLATRLSFFFLGALAVVLLGFSATLFFLAWRHFDEQLNERLTAALDTLEAAIDREPDGLEWDVQEHPIFLGRETTADVVRWQVTSNGNVVDCSRNLTGTELASVLTQSAKDEQQGVKGVEAGNRTWQVACRLIRSEKTSAKTHDPNVPRHATLLLTAGAPLEPMQSTMRRLALALLGLSTALWFSAAIAGRWFGRKALAPLTRMAAAAKKMTATQLGERLPDPKTTDELGELQRAFNELLDRVEEAFERQARFTGDASHQLRTPLTAMLGQVEVALRRERPEVDYRQALTLVQTQAEHMRQMVEALLFLARADGDADLAGLETIDLSLWLGNHLRQWAQHPRFADIRVESSDKAQVRVQPLLLQQLVDNLLENACKYSAPRSPVRITLKREKSFAVLSVEDSGEGIGPEDLPHVFEPFYRSSEARRQGKAGVGLGLPMAKRIAKVFGGTLTVESELRHGSRFTLHLPLAGPSVETTGARSDDE